MKVNHYFDIVFSSQTHLNMRFGQKGAILHQLKGVFMLSYSITFLIIALIAGVLGLVGLAGLAMEIARILFVVFLVLFVVSLVAGRRPPI